MDLFSLPKLALCGFLSSIMIPILSSCFTRIDVCVLMRLFSYYLYAYCLCKCMSVYVCVFARSPCLYAFIHLLPLKCPLGTKENYFTVCCI